MKPICILIIAAIALSAVSAKAQIANSPNNAKFSSPVGNSDGIDTLNNSDSLVQQLALPGWWDVVTIVPLVNRISGTVGGTVKPFGSIDGGDNTYVQIGKADTIINGSFQNFVFSVNPSIYSSYFIEYRGVGTMSAQVSTYALWRRTNTTLK